VRAALLILVWISIMGTVVLGGYATTHDAFQKTICRANLRSIDGAIHTYYAHYEKWPSSIKGLVRGRFLSREPREPQGGSYFILKTDGRDPHAVCSKEHMY
jgi:competence protein ComGC